MRMAPKVTEEQKAGRSKWKSIKSKDEKMGASKGGRARNSLRLARSLARYKAIKGVNNQWAIKTVLCIFYEFTCAV